MLVSITKIELSSYSKLRAFFRFNGQIIRELQQSPCRKYKISGSWNLKSWYTMTLWSTEEELTRFYRSGTHLEAMKQSKFFSSRIQSMRVEQDDLLNWKEAKKLFQKS